MSYQPINNTSTPGLGTDSGANTRLLPQLVNRTTFASVLASSFDSAFWTQIGATGAGQTISQSAGNGVITAGTTANTETIVRSIRTFTGSFLLRAHSVLSQRIANNNFYVEMVDVIGDALSITVNSATSVTVTIPSNPFTSANVGQSMYIGALAGFTGVTSLPGRYAIASIAGNNVTFTVASWATGAGNTGTCSLFGWNYHQILYTSTTATQASYDTQRRGWNTGFTVATINTTASPGHMAIMGSEDGDAFLSDQLIASGTTAPITRRASRVTNLAEEATPLYLQLRCANGSANPASGTTWTIGTISVENYASQQVTIANAKAQSNNTVLPISVENTPAVTVSSGTVTTVSTVTSLTTLANGQTAHSSASTGSPVRVGGRVAPTTIATVDTTLVAGDASETAITTAMQNVVKPFSGSELDITIPVLPGVTTTTVQSILGASGTASVRNYLTGLTIQTDTLGAAGSVFVLDGQGAIGTSVTIATPGVFTSATHDLRVGDAIIFTSLGTITGVSTNTVYYVTATSFAATTFTLALTPGGTAIQITGATAAFTFYRIFHVFRLPTTAITSPIQVNFSQPLKGQANVASNILIPVSLTSGAIYLTVNGYRGF